MAGLMEGKQYSLISEDKINSNKSLIFVKLTDSALRSIEEYVKLEGASSTLPSTIQFQDNSGVITVPVNGSNQTYEFKLSDFEADGPQGSFECLQQNGNRFLESLGCMLMKLHIHANEDSYENTRVKMAAAEKEQKKFCTKEIMPNNTRFGRKVQVPPKTALKPLNTSLPSFKKEQELPKNSRQNQNNNFSQCFDFLHQPIRNRIIHILAAKPYKRAELLLRLKKEGVSEKDKDQISEILVQVAKLKGSILSLADHIWDEIQEDWEFCSKEELQLIKKKKQQFLKSKNLNEVADVSNPLAKQKKSVISTLNINKNLPNKKENLLLNDDQNKNSNQNESCVPKKNTLTNGSKMHSTKSLSHPHDFNGSLKNSNAGKGHSSLSSHKRKLFEINDKHLTSNGSSQEEKKESTAASSLSQLQTSVRQKLRNLGINLKNDEESMEIVSNGLDINEDENEASNLMTHNTVSVSKKNKCSNVPKIPVKQSNNCVDNPKLKQHNYFAEKLEHYRQILLASPPPPAKINKKKGRKTKVLPPSETVTESKKPVSPAAETVQVFKESEVSPVAEAVPEFDISELPLKYTEVKTPVQKSQYIKDYNSELEEHDKLLNEMKEKSDKFSALIDQLKATTDESPEYMRIKLEISKEHIKDVNNGYDIRRKKYEYLRAKLTLITELLEAYNKNSST